MSDSHEHRYRPALGDERHRRDVPAHTPAAGDLVEVDTFVGCVVRVTPRTVTLEDRRGRRRHFALDGQLAWVDEGAVRLVPGPGQRVRDEPRVTPSGSIAAAREAARVARASRIWVEGIHDAELLERVWGDDLRAAGVVVEPLGGIDGLVADVARFGPGPDRRLGVLVDHLVPGSKEQRIAARIDDPHVLVAGHDAVDVWAAVRPSVLGIDAWPTVPVDEEWKQGVCDRLGYPDPSTLWRELRSRVGTWKDLDRSLVNAVERLLDHVTA